MSTSTENEELLSKAVTRILDKIDVILNDYSDTSAEEIEHLSHSVLILTNAKSILEDC